MTYPQDEPGGIGSLGRGGPAMGGHSDPFLVLLFPDVVVLARRRAT